MGGVCFSSYLSQRHIGPKNITKLGFDLMTTVPWVYAVIFDSDSYIHSYLHVDFESAL